MTETNSSIQIKGLRDGLLVSLDDAPWEEQRTGFFTQVDAQPAFFKGARLALDVSSQVLHVNDLVDLRDQLSERGIFLWAIISESPTTEKTAQLLGLATRISKPRSEESRQFLAAGSGEDGALVLDKSLRSGTWIEVAGNVVGLGDGNPVAAPRRPEGLVEPGPGAHRAAGRRSAAPAGGAIADRLMCPPEPGLR